MKNIFLFDFAQTIAELVPDRAKILNDYIGETTALQLDEKIVQRAYQHLDTCMPYSSVKIRDRESKKCFYDEYNRMLLNILGIEHLVDVNKLFEVFSSRKSHWALKKEVTGLFSELKSAGKTIGIISNFDSTLREIVLEHLKIGDMVDFLHISQEQDCEKPDIGFYQSFFKEYELEVAESCYVGDSYTLDYLPAKEIGLDVFLLDENGCYTHLPESVRTLQEAVRKVL